jgi:hypothetical protein
LTSFPLDPSDKIVNTIHLSQNFYFAITTKMPGKGAQSSGSGGVGRGKGKFKNMAKQAEDLTKNQMLHCECF